MKKLLALCVATCAALAAGRPAEAATAVVGAPHPTELRVAFAQTPGWSTTWTSLRLAGEHGAFLVVLPLPEGAFVDLTSDAWFESLEVATAPRVFPPEGLSPVCPGASGADDPFEITASVGHVSALTPTAVALFETVPELSAWAAGQSLTVSAELAASLGAAPATRFMGLLFSSGADSVATPTVRVAAPDGPPVLPFSITRAGSSDVRVTTWLFGEGRGALDGTTLVPVPGNAIAWNAKTAKSNYVTFRDVLLGGQADRITLESAGHDALSDSVSIANDTASIDALAATYFDRASAYGNATGDPDLCAEAAKLSLASDLPVSGACPRGDLAALSTCAWDPTSPDAVDPATLLCGPGADDLALALTGAVPGEAWLTRRTFVIPANAPGKDRPISFAPAPEKLPLVEAGSVDVGECFGGGGSTTTTTSGGGGAPPTGSGSGNAGQGGQSSSGSGSGSEESDTIYVDTSGCSCGSTIESADTYDSGGDCSGDTSSGDDCSGDSSGDDCSGDSSGDDCSGDSSGDDCSGDSSGDSCSGDAGGGDSCSGGDGGDCSVAMNRKGHRRVGPRLSVLVLGALAGWLPIRRRGTRKRRGLDP